MSCWRRRWLVGLILAVVALSLLSFLAFRNNRWMRPAYYIFGGFMLLNGMMHIVGSFWWSRWLPGVISAPLLVIASIWLLVRARLAE